MGQNFISGDREQVFLMPPSVADWVPEDHLVWSVLEAVEQLDLSAFYAAYRADGHGRPAYEPAMMPSLLLYAYARGNRSSRQIERACVEDVAYRVVAANLMPDHSTIADFRRRHEAAPARLVQRRARHLRTRRARQGRCRRDRRHEGSGERRNRREPQLSQIAREILAEAAETDRREDELCGAARGDELPEHLRTREGLAQGAA